MPHRAIKAWDDNRCLQSPHAEQQRRSLGYKQHTSGQLLIVKKQYGLESRVKLAFGFTKRTKNKYLVYIKHSVYSKIGCNVDQQTSKQSASCRVCSQTHKNDPNKIQDSGARSHQHQQHTAAREGLGLLMTDCRFPSRMKPSI